MKLHIWTDRVSYLAVAHAESVSEARELLLKESDLGESGDGSCSERDKARRAILSNTSAVYVGRVAEFSLSDNAQLREQEDHSEKLHQQIAAKERRIAELEAALGEIWRIVAPGAYEGVDYSGSIGRIKGICQIQREACWMSDGKTGALDALLAQARREALADYLREAREFSERTFGAGRRTLGVTKHIEKEIAEVRAKPDDLTEWVDIIILACDGYWRHGGQPENLLADMLVKLAKNKARVWPTPTSEDEPVEHDRTHDDPLNPELGPEHREFWLRRMAREVEP